MGAFAPISNLSDRLYFVFIYDNEEKLVQR